MNNNQKGFTPIITALIVLILAGAGGTGYYLITKQPPKQTICTTETKICPDGSSVGRTGPNCEFALCPEVEINKNLTVRYSCSSRNSEYLYFSGSDHRLYRYNTKTRETEIIKIFDETIPGPNAASRDFSPNCKYVTIDCGTAPGPRFCGLYNIENDKIVEGTGGGYYAVWSSDETKFVIAEPDIHYSVGADLDLSSLYLYEIKNNKATSSLLIKSTKKESYYPVKWISENVLMFKKEVFSEEIKNPDGISITKEIINFNSSLYENRKFEYLLINVNDQKII
ncbi:MAG: hypothetical protein WC122_01185 [archaeon]